MEKHDMLTTFFILWGFVLLFEIVWFNGLVHSPHSISEVVFAVTLIVATCVFGSVGIYLLKSTRK